MGTGLRRVEGRPSSLGDGDPGPGADSFACGVRIVRGRHQDPNKIQCVTDPAATAHGSKKIAFACCDDANRCSRMDEDGQCYAGDRAVAPKGWYEASEVCAAEGKVLCGVDKPCSRTGYGYDITTGGRARRRPAARACRPSA